MKKDFLGKWLITEMEQWDKDYIDLEEDGYFAIKKKGSGEFKFGAVEGQMDCVIAKIGNEERLEFTWDGSDEMDPVSGRGWITFKAMAASSMSTFSSTMRPGRSFTGGLRGITPSRTVAICGHWS